MIKIALAIPALLAALFGGGYYLTQEQNLGAVPVIQVQQGGTGWGEIQAGTYLTGNGTGKLSTSTCAQITGSADLCDGNDASGAGGGSGNVATSTNETAGRLAYWTTTSGTPAKLGEVATGTLTGGDGLTVDNVRSVIGGSLDIDCDTANGSTFGCLSSTDWTTFNSKLGTYDAWTHPTASVSATTSGIIINAASSTITGNLTIVGNSTTTNATTTALYVSGSTKLGSLTGLLKATSGLVTTATAQVDYLTSVDPFPSASTSTLLTFTGGILVNAATSTITNLVIKNSTTTNATTTGVDVVTGSYSSTTNFFANGLSACNTTTGKLLWSAGVFSCGTDFNVAAGDPFPSNATTTGLIINAASTTITNLSVKNSTTTNATTTGVLAVTGSYATTTNFFANGLSACNTTTGKLLWSAGVFSCGTDFNVAAGDPFPSNATTTGLIINAASSTITNLSIKSSTTTNATTTNLGVSGAITFNGVTGSTWASFCSTITGSADLCDGADASGSGGGNMSGWATTTIASQLILYPVNATTTDVVFGSDATTTAPFWWDESATTTYIGNGGTGTSSAGFSGGTGVNKWWNVGSYSATGVNQGNFVIASSSAAADLLTNPFFIIDQTGSTTIGANSQATGLTIAGGATTTGTHKTATVRPITNDVGTLGVAGAAYEDLFLTEGGTINFDNGDVIVTQTGNALAISGGDTLQKAGTSFSIENASGNSYAYIFNNGGSGTANLTISDFTDTLDIDLAGIVTVVGGLFANAGATVASFLQIPNGTGPTVDAVGEFALDTTDNQILVGTSTNASYPVVIPTKVKLWSATIASTSVDFVSGGVIPLAPQRDGFTIKEIHCYVEKGTSVVINLSQTSGSADTETVTCDTDGASDTDITTNNTVLSTATSTLEIGTVTGSVDYLTFSIWGVYTRE